MQGRILKRAFSKLRLEHVVIGKGQFKQERSKAEATDVMTVRVTYSSSLNNCGYVCLFMGFGISVIHLSVPGSHEVFSDAPRMIYPLGLLGISWFLSTLLKYVDY